MKRYIPFLTIFFLLLTVRYTSASEISYQLNYKDTPLNFTSETNIGQELNNPLGIEIYSSTTNEDTFVYWMKSIDSPTPQVTYDISQGNTNVHNNTFGIMIKDSQIYISVYENEKWKWKIPQYEEYISFFDSDSNEVARISVPEVDITTNTYEISFNQNLISDISGVREYSTLQTGNYMLMASIFNSISSPIYTNIAQLGVDLTKPEIESLTYEVIGEKEVEISWEVSDLEGGVDIALGDVYRPVEGSFVRGPITYLGPDNVKEFPLEQMNSSDDVGNLEIDNCWKVYGLGQRTLSRTENININQNTGGKFDFYIVVFDQSGNYKIKSIPVMISSWIITRGGNIFSKDGTYVGSRYLALTPEANWAENLWISPYPSQATSTQVFDSNKADFTTEMLMGEVEYTEQLNDIAYADPLKTEYLSGAFKLQIQSKEESLYYEYFRNKVLDSVEKIDVEQTVFSQRASDYCTQDICALVSQEDIYFEEGFICDRKATFITRGNIYIEPDLLNGNEYSGCIFVAKGNIEIGEGEYKSRGSLTPRYDVVEGFLISDGEIIVQLSDQYVSVKDGLQLNGGMYAMGGEDASIHLLRNMRFEDRNIYPSIAVFNDSRYGKISEKIFGIEKNVNKQDVGFKPY